MFSKITFAFLLILLIGVTPAWAVQIEETNSNICNSIMSVEGYNANLGDGVNDYRLKENTITSINTVFGGLAPPEKPKAEEGFSTIELVIMSVFIVILVWGMIKMGYAALDMAYCKDYMIKSQTNDLNGLEEYGSRVDRCVELMDNMQAMDEWHVNLEGQLVGVTGVEGLDSLCYTYIEEGNVYYMSPLEKITQEYERYYSIYEEYYDYVNTDFHDPGWRNNEVTGYYADYHSYSTGQHISYNQAKSFLHFSIGITSFGALGLISTLLKIIYKIK